MKVLDVSEFQPNIDYSVVAESVDGVIIRAGVTGWGWQELRTDSCFEKHYSGFKAAGVPVGAYYYSAADSEDVARREANYFLSLLKGKQFELPVYVDIENTQRQEALTRDRLTKITGVFCNAVEAAGYFSGYYTMTGWLMSKLDWKALSRYTLWKADVRSNYDTSIPCDMHQYTWAASVPGITGNVDMSNCTRDFKSTIVDRGLNGFGKGSIQDDSNSIKALKQQVEELKKQLQDEQTARNAEKAEMKTDVQKLLGKYKM